MNNEDLCEQCGCPIHPCLPCEEVVMLNGNHTDDAYKDLLKLILREGKTKKNRTGVDTIGVFGAQAKFDINLDAFPILTTKKIFFKAIVHELLWFIKGDTNIKYLVDNDVHIWDDWAYKRHCEMCKRTNRGLPTQEEFIHHLKTNPKSDFGELGEGTYGGMWRAFPYYYEAPQYEYGSPNGSIDGMVGYVDQLQNVINKLRFSPDDRRIIVSAWHPYWVDHCALPPCHCLFHFNAEELTLDERWDLIDKYNWIPEKKCYRAQFMKTDQNLHEAMDSIGVPRRKLNCLLYQRSCDTFLGVPFNITSYCLLTAMIAQCVGMTPGVFTHTYGDLHIYKNHLNQVQEQLERTPRVLPSLHLNSKIRNLWDFTFDDIKLEGYNPHPAIKAPIAV